MAHPTVIQKLEREWRAREERRRREDEQREQQRLAAEAHQRRAHEARQRAADQARERTRTRELSEARDRIAKIERRQEAARTALRIEAMKRQEAARWQALQNTMAALNAITNPPPPAVAPPEPEFEGVSLLDRLSYRGI